MATDLLIEDRDFITKEWGVEEVLVNNEQYCSKLLHILPGYRCSLHLHSVKDESFFCVSGLVHVEYYVDGTRRDTLLSGWRRDGLHIPHGTPHRFWSETPDPAVLLEVSTPHHDSDVTRLDPSGPCQPSKSLQT
jgi:mannose-6-phosphate isomerase-like protein (cupin superfamily)